MRRNASFSASESVFGGWERGIPMLRRMLQTQRDARAKGRDPIAVSFDPTAPPIVLKAGNYIREE